MRGRRKKQVPQSATLIAFYLPGLEMAKQLIDEALDRQMDAIKHAAGIRDAAPVAAVNANGAQPAARKRHHISAKGRANIAAAQKRRWAALKTKAAASASKKQQRQAEAASA